MVSHMDMGWKDMAIVDNMCVTIRRGVHPFDFYVRISLKFFICVFFTRRYPTVLVDLYFLFIIRFVSISFAKMMVSYGNDSCVGMFVTMAMS